MALLFDQPSPHNVSPLSPLAAASISAADHETTDLSVSAVAAFTTSVLLNIVTGIMLTTINTARTSDITFLVFFFIISSYKKLSDNIPK